MLGVPFLGAKDRCVQLKRDYNSRCVQSHTKRLFFHFTSSHCTVSSLLDGHTTSLLDGNTWYKMQVIRAIRLGMLGLLYIYFFLRCIVICCRL
jgi:hypothetical protein